MEKRSVSVQFTTKSNGFSEATAGLPSEFSRAHSPYMAINPGNRVKAWGVGIDNAEYEINGVSGIVFAPNSAGTMFSAQLTDEQSQTIKALRVAPPPAPVIPVDPQSPVNAATPPPPPPPTFPAIPSVGSAESMFENANARWRSMIPYYHAARRGHVTMTNEQANIYFLFRRNRSTKKHWHATGRDFLESDINESLVAAEAWLVRWNAFLAWYDSQAMTEKKVAAHLSVPHLGSETLGSLSDKARAAAEAGDPKDWRANAAEAQEKADIVYISSQGGHTSARDIFYSQRGVYNSFRKRIADAIQVVEERVAIFRAVDDEGDLSDTVMNDLIEVISNFGVTPMTEWNAKEDGHLYFKDAEDNIYFAKLSVLVNVIGSGGRYKYTIDKVPSMRSSRTMLRPMTDLLSFAVGLGNAGVNMGDIGRPFQDHFGAFDGIKWNFEALDDADYPGNTNPFK